MRHQRLVAMALAAVAPSCSAPTGDPPVALERIIWKVNVPESTTRDPAFADGVVYFMSPADHSVSAVRGSTGQVLWRTVAPGAPLPLAGQNLVVAGQTVAMSDVDIYGFDRSTGNLLWTFRGFPDDEPGRHRLTSDAATIYAATFRGRMQAINPVTGVAKWTVDLARGDPQVSAFDPVVEGTELYVGTKRFDADPDGTLYALDASTGALRWRYDFTPEFPNLFSGCLGPALVSGNLVITSQEDGRLFAFDRATGQVRWVAAAALPGGATRGNDKRFLSRVGEDLLATSLNGSLTLLNAQTGTVKWKVSPIFASIISPPATDGTNAWVSQAGVFAVYSLRTGAIVWSDPAVPGTEPSEFFGGPLLDADRIYVPGPTGFYAIRK